MLLKGLIIINFKNYLEISGSKSLQLSRIAEEVTKEYDISIFIAPPNPSLSQVCNSVKIPVICQHLDNAEVGASTGFFIPEMAKSFGSYGSLLNHSEHRIDISYVGDLIRRLKKLDMTSIVCARTPNEAGTFAKFDPEYIAIEPPELIGSGKSVSMEDPDIIMRSLKEVQRNSSYSNLICGAGITTKEDVQKAVELGSEGILIASGLIKSTSWKDKLIELVEGFF